MKYFLLVFLISATFIAQSKQSKKDSIITSSQSVKQINENLRDEIDSLKKLRDSLQQKLQTELRDLYIIRYGEDAGGKVAMGQIWTGMTEEMMRDSWGEPDSITVNNQTWGKYSQWYYGEITYFFKEGALFEWEAQETIKE